MVSKKALNILFILYIMMVVFAVFMQNGRKSITAENIDSLVNLVPLKNTINDIVYLIQNGLRGNMNLFANTFGNIVLFIPLSFFLTYIFKYRILWKVLLTALFLSLWVEVMQYVFILGVSDIDDVLLNVVGAFVGWSIVCILQLCLHQRS